MRYSSNLNLSLYDVGDKWNHENWNTNMDILDNLINDISDRTSEINTDNAIFSTSVTAPNFIGNASSATKFETARNITIGSQTLLFDGSNDISFDLTSIEAADRIHTHDYLPLAGGILTGILRLNRGVDWQQIKIYSGSGYERRVEAGDTLLRFDVYNSDNNNDNRRFLDLRSLDVSSAAHAILMHDVVGGVDTTYTILHSGNYVNHINHVTPLTSNNITLDTDNTITWQKYGNLSTMFLSESDLLVGQASKYGNLLNINGYGYEVSQLYFCQPDGPMLYRCGNVGDGNGYYCSWRTVLDTSNYNGYALPLTGGTLTGPIRMGFNYNNLWMTTPGGKERKVEIAEDCLSMVAYSANANENRRFLNIYDAVSQPNNDYALRLIDTVDGVYNEYTILHSGNYTNYAVATNGGTLTNPTFAGNGYFPTGFNFTLVGADNGEYSIDLQNESNTGMFFHIWSQTNTSILRCDADTGLTTVYYALQCNSNATIAAGLSVTGNINCTGSVYNAVWNDYAEYFEKGQDTEPGDIISMNPSREDIESYIKAVYGMVVCGIHSDSYGHLVGGVAEVPEGYDGDSMKYNEENFIPVGMTGRVKCKVIGPVMKGDKIYASEIPGVGQSHQRIGGGANWRNLLLVMLARVISTKILSQKSKCSSDKNRKGSCL